MDHDDWDKPWVHQMVGPPSELSIEPLRGNRWLTDNVWRLSGPAGSVVVKTVHETTVPGEDTWSQHWAAARSVRTHWNYWRREYLAYVVGIPQAYARYGIRSPVLLHHEHSEGGVLLVLEEVRGLPATRWNVDTYLSCASRLGLAHAALSHPGSFVHHPWLCEDYLNDYALEKPFDRGIVQRDQAWATLERYSSQAATWRRALTQFAASEEDLTG